MQPEIEQLKPRFKEVLYRCMEEIRATKAALYLLDENAFVLMTHYGFSDAIRKSIPPTDPLPDRLLMRRVPFFVNALMDEPRFSEMLFSAGTERLLAAPIYSRGRLAGFIDMRDKAAKQPFDASDLAQAQKIVEQYLELFAEKQLYGQQSIQVVSSPEKGSELLAANVARLVETSRTIVSRQLSGPGALTRDLSEPEMTSIGLSLPGILLLDGALLVSFTSFGSLGGGQIIAARGPLDPATVEHFEAKLTAWIRKRGESDQISRRTIHYPFGDEGAPLVAERVQSVLSAPVKSRVQGLVLSIGFDRTPGAATRAHLEVFLNQIQQAVEAAIAYHGARQAKQKVAEKLIEPDFQKYPHLMAHSRRVSSLAEQFAQFVGLEPADVENTRLAGLVHDVAMRMLDYQGVYRKREISDAEMKMIQEHPLISAALVAESGLGHEVARIVLCHHERMDGKGYPSGLSGDQIPVTSRILHICEAFDAMTASDSYQVPLPESEAVDRIVRGGGTQFDQSLAEKFRDLMTRVTHV